MYLRKASMLVLLFATVLFAKLAHGQGYGAITGIVTDSTGAIVPGAQVTLVQTSTGVVQKTTTTGDGTYTFPSLAPSVYNLSVSQTGFTNYRENAIQVRADQSVTANAVLRAGSTSESVEVTATTAQVDTTTGTLSQVIGQASVNDLPLNGRNAAQLTELVAGVQAAPASAADQGATKSFPTVISISANGTRVGQTNYLLDGGNNVDEYTNVNEPFPMPDSLQEFSVQTSNYNAEYGQNAGGVVNIITRSGASQYHGNVFEFVRNRVFNAANYFTYVGPVKTVDPLKRNQFGGTFGGPVKIPHLFNDKGGFFFVGYQKTIYHTVSVSASTATLPTAAQLAGTFANESGCISDPLQPTHVYPCTQTGTTSTGAPLYTTQVSTADYDRFSQNLLTHLPVSSAAANGTYNFLKPTLDNYNEFTGRFDQQIGPKDHLVARVFQDVFHQAADYDPTDLLTYGDQVQQSYYNSLISETHTFSDRLVNNFIVSYQLHNDQRGPTGDSINVNDLGSNIFNPTPKQINQITITGYISQIGDNPQAYFERANYTAVDDIHYELGQHSLAAGFHFESSKIDINNLYRQPGVFIFNSTTCSTATVAGACTASTGVTHPTPDAMAAFLLGNTGEFEQASGQFFNGRDNFYGTYVQDSWKATRRLTLNYGLRYEPFTPWRESQGRMGSFFPNLWAAGTHSAKYPLAPAGLLFAGDAGFNPSGVDVELLHFMPRLGFALDVFGNGKTSLRGGGGLFYDSRINSTLFNIYTNNSPFITNVDIKNQNGAVITPENPYGSYGIANPFPAPQPPPSTAPIPTQSFLTYDPFRGFQDPRFVSYNLALEQQLTPSLSSRIAYVGSEGRHQVVSVEINPYVNGVQIYNQPGCSANNSCYPNNITEANTGANSNYNSLQMSLEQRSKFGLNVIANYTWSRSLDNLVQNIGNTSIGANSSYVLPITVPNFKRLDYGPSDFDHTNVSSISYVYTIPHFAGEAPKAVQYIVNGWETTGLVIYTTGDPLTIYNSSNNVSGSGQNRDRAVWNGRNPRVGATCPASPTTHCKPWLNGADFSAPTAGTYGNVTKGEFRGPQYVDWDVSLAKRFQLYKQANLQFRAEYFNVLNHTNLGDPNTTFSTATNNTFGQITSTAPQNSNANATYQPRIAQLSLKLQF